MVLYYIPGIKISRWEMPASLASYAAQDKQARGGVDICNSEALFFNASGVIYKRYTT